MYEIPEDWRILPGTNQAYAATPEGDIVRLPRTVHTVRLGKPVTRQYPAKVLKQTECGGYRVVGLSIGGVSCVQRVHRLVCIAYHGAPPSLDKQWVLHGDGNPANNRPDNLRWGSAQDNSDDAAKHATRRVTCAKGVHTWHVNPHSPNPSRSRCISCEADDRFREWEANAEALDKHLAELTALVRAWKSGDLQMALDRTQVA